MSSGKFQIIKRVLIVIVAFFVAYSAVANNLLVAILSIVIGLLLLTLLKKQTKAVLEDERTKVIGEKAARVTVTIVGVVLASISLLLITFTGEENIYLESLGIVLSYTTVFILIVYSISYWFFDRELSAENGE